LKISESNKLQVPGFSNTLKETMVFMKYPAKNQHLHNKLFNQFLEYFGEPQLYINNGCLAF
jgi:hypothetical protein